MSRRAAVSAVLGATATERLIAFSGGIPDFLTGNPVLALSGFRAMAASAVALPAHGDGLLAVSPSWDVGRARAVVGGALDVAACDDLAVVASRLIGGARRVAVVGLDDVEEHVRVAVEHGGAEVVPVERELTRLIGRKTPAEIANARLATELAATAFGQLLGLVEVGVAEHELIAELDALLAHAGAEDNFVLMSSGPVGRPLRQPTGRRLERGDIVGIEVSPCVGGQFTQLCRTIVVGKASEAQRAEYAVLAAGYRAGLAAARAGVTAGAVARAVDAPIVEAGYGEYCRPPYMRVRGHGLGLSDVAPGAVGRENETPLEPGMVFVLHPNQHLPGSGYLLCGGPVLIGDDGAEPLLDWEPRIDEVAV
jgi:Xaa-Pro aminopeptidase